MPSKLSENKRNFFSGIVNALVDFFKNLRSKKSIAKNNINTPNNLQQPVKSQVQKKINTIDALEKTFPDGKGGHYVDGHGKKYQDIPNNITVIDVGPEALRRIKEIRDKLKRIKSGAKDKLVQNTQNEELGNTTNRDEKDLRKSFARYP